MTGRQPIGAPSRDTSLPGKTRRKLNDLPLVAKLSLGFGLLLGIVAITAGLLADKVDDLDRQRDRVTRVAQPLSAASYEMEISLIASGMGVLSYLRQPNPDFVAQFREDEREFALYRERFQAVAPNDEARKLGDRVSKLYSRFHELGSGLIATKDRQVEAFDRFVVAVRKIDRLLGDRVPAFATGADPMIDAIPSLSEFRAELAEASLWLTGHMGTVGSGYLERLEEDRQESFLALERLRVELGDRGHAVWAGQLGAATVGIFTNIDAIVEIDLQIERDVAELLRLKGELHQLLDETVRILAQRELLGAQAAADEDWRDLQLWLVISGVLLLLAIALTVFLIGVQVVRPIRALTAGARALAREQFGHRIELESNDELGRLSETFNSMAGQLQASRENLELEVRKRTAALAEISRRLEEELVAGRALEAQLRQSQKMESLGTLAGGIAHEFNNLLYMMMGWTQLVQGRLPDGDPLRGHLDKVLSVGERSKVLVEKILSFSRQQDVDLKPVPVDDLINEIVPLLQASLPATVTLETRIDEAPGAVLADTGQFGQVLVNLVVNAFQAMEGKPGSVVVAARERSPGLETSNRPIGLGPGNQVEITVTDNGCGIAADELPRIFDPFFTTKTIGEGTGLGLALAHGIVTSHGGAIEVTSEEDLGTTVRILLPSCTKSSDPAAAPASGTKNNDVESAVGPGIGTGGSDADETGQDNDRDDRMKSVGG